MKKILIFLIIILITSIVAMFFLEEKEYIKEQENEVEKVAMKSDITVLGPTKTVKKIKLKVEKLDEEAIKNNQWMKDIREIFESELVNDSDAYDDYQSMKASFEEDRMNAYDDFMDQIRKEKKSFNITELEDGKYKEVEEEYLKAFQMRYGQKVFLKYLEAIEKHNEENPTFPLYF